MASPHHLVLALACPDRPGIVHAVTGVLARHGGNVTESQQFGDPESASFFMRVQFEMPGERPALGVGSAEGAGDVYARVCGDPG